MGEPVHRLLYLLFLCSCVAVALSSPSPPKATQREFRTRNRARTVPNPLLSSRQVNPDTIRSGARKRQGCPAPQVSGNCCPAGKTFCETSCTDTSTDIQNCGTCGATCINGFCAGGMCECGAGTLLCDGACIACPAHSICGSDGQCACNNVAGYYSCDNVCNNYQSDIENCGMCGATCLNGFCAGGMCECGAGTLLCDGACISCPAHSACGSDGQCVCNSALGYYSCNGICNNYQTDMENCGFCGNVCSSGSCNGGTCCPTDEPDICNSVCTSLAADPLNCGACNAACGSNQICSVTCMNCPTGTQACDNECVALTSIDNCGACGNVCAPGIACIEFSVPGEPTSYGCVSTAGQCQGLIQVWNAGYFIGYLYSMGSSPGPDLGIYGWNSQGTIFSIKCGGGTELDITSLAPGDVPYIYPCAAESDSSQILLVTGCEAETNPGSQPSMDDTSSQGSRLAETAIWSMNADTHQITASWVDASGSSPPVYLVDIGENIMFLTTDLAGTQKEYGPLSPFGSVSLLLIFVVEM